ncbi:hypothetical protein [Actinoplanes sp. NPDC051411]|uniref:hypothetical protein n=1 Tax=Actinoplanes sp. NPDC051411 TaxID=3155522 RepID=UPI0034333F8D
MRVGSESAGQLAPTRGRALSALQVTGEPSLTGPPHSGGAEPRLRKRLANRPEHHQAQVLETSIRTVHRLRDADSDQTDLFRRFGT